MPKNDDEMPRRWREHEIQQAQFTNGETGEVIAGTLTGLVPQQSRRRKKRKEIKFAMIDIEAMPKLVMSKGEWSLFWAVVSYTDRERGESRVSTKELADRLDWEGSNTSRALTKLCRRNIIIRERPGVLRVNPRLIARGQVDQWESAMEKAPEIDWTGES